MKQAMIAELSLNQIHEKLAEEKKMYVKLKLNHAVSSIENPLKIRSSRRLIAKLKTEINKRSNAEKSAK